MKETFNSGKIKSFKKDSRISKQSKNVSIKSQPNTDNFFYVEEISAHFDEVEDDEESFQDDQEDYEGLEDENLEDDKRILIEEFDDYEPPTKKLAIKISNNFESEQEEDTEDTKFVKIFCLNFQ